MSKPVMYVGLAGLVTIVAILIFFTPAKESFQEWGVGFPTQPVEEVQEVNVVENFTGNETFSASPTAGAAPLAVTFTIHGQGNYQLDFGDGERVGPAVCMEGASCAPYNISHTYTAAGTYTATLSGHVGGPSGPEQLIGSVSVTVR